MDNEMDTVSQKLEIGGVDLYVHAGWDHGGVLRYLDLRLGMGADANVRAALELVVLHAAALVDAGVWTLENMYTAWRATHLDPCGICPQVEGIVTSPLDAAARLLETISQRKANERMEAQARMKASERDAHAS